MADMNFSANLLPTTTNTYTIGNSDKQWTIYGTLNGNSTTTSRLDSFDTRSATRTPENTPRGITLNFKENGTDSLSDGGSYNGLLSWRSYSTGSDLTGGYPIEISYTANGNLWTRMGTGADSWGSWNKILNSSNYSSVLDDRYVNVSGDTMSGALYINLGATSTPSLRWNKSGTYWGGIGYGGTGNENYFGPVNSDGSWVTSPSVTDIWTFKGSVKSTEECIFPNGFKTGSQATSGTGSGVKIGTDGGIEIYHSSTPFIDFHYQASTSDYSVRLICDSADSISCSGKFYGAVWNDYAEYRQSIILEPGKCVIEKGDDTLVLSTKRMQPGAEIVSDTFGFAIGETDDCKTPIAASGRVLAYPYEDREVFRQNIGKPVCSGPNGTVSIMSDEEYAEKGYCAIGFISAVPDYEVWGSGNVKVNNRVWIRVR